MYKRAFIVTDLSEGSWDLVGECGGVLRKFGVKGCVIGAYPFHGSLSRLRDEAVMGHLKGFFLGILRDAEESLKGYFEEVSSRIVEGDPEDLVRIAASQGCDLLVVPRRKEMGLRRLLGGSLALSVAGACRMPTLVIPGSCGDEVLPRVLFPTDFSPNAESAFGVLKGLLGLGVEEVTLLHVQEDRRIVPHLEHRLEEFNRIDAERLDRLSGLLRDLKRDLKVDVLVERGSAPERILSIADSKGCSMVIMGAKGRSGLKEALWGSVSEQVLMASGLPVLLIP